MNSKNEKVNQKVLCTKRKLRDSLLTLMREKANDQITVTELCRHAQVNRNTFYTYYECPRALLHSIENELYENILCTWERSAKHRNSIELLTDILEALLGSQDLCRVLFSDPEDNVFLNRIIALDHDRVIAEWREEGLAVNERQAELLYLFLSRGNMAIIRRWTQNGMEQRPRELAEFIINTSHQGLGGHIRLH